MATQEREKIKRMNKRKTARWHGKGENHLEQDSVRQATIDGTDGGLYIAVDGQGLSEVIIKSIIRFDLA